MTEKLASDTSIDRRGRETWAGKLDFLMTLIGYSVGLGNFWRFPYLCYKNGGGVFLIPYFVTLLGAGIPLLFMQVSLGQFMSKSGPGAWDIYPICKGLGVATIFIESYVSLYYIVVLSWSLYYLYSTIVNSDMPWTVCLDSYGPNCVSVSQLSNRSDDGAKEAAELFWTKGVLGLSEDMESIGGIQLHSAVSLLAAWVIVYVCIIKGVKFTGKIVWFTGLFPYAMLTVLLIRGVTLEGAMNGLKYYLKPDFSKLWQGSVWLDAGTQIMFSMGLGDGTMSTLGSFNKYRHNSLRDSITYSIVNCLTSLFGGFCIFSTLGYMAFQRGIDISDVSDGGPGLVFIAYPTALSLLPIGSRALTASFFLMILFLGLDSQFVSVEGLTRQIMDTFASSFQFRFARKVLITCLSIFFFSVGLIFTTNAGMYYFQILDFYSASGFIVLFLCFCQSVAISYLYGGVRFMRDIESMMPVGILRYYFLICWYVVSPLICIFIAIMFWINFSPLTYGDFTYPLWSTVLGWMIASPSFIAVWASALVLIFKYRGNLSALSTPRLRQHQLHEYSKKPYKLIPEDSDNQIEMDSSKC